jgi:hypothetical protein
MPAVWPQDPTDEKLCLRTMRSAAIASAVDSASATSLSEFERFRNPDVHYLRPRPSGDQATIPVPSSRAVSRSSGSTGRHIDHST